MSEVAILVRHAIAVRAFVALAAAALLSITFVMIDRQADGATLAVVEMQPGIHESTVGEDPFTVVIQVDDLVHEGCVSSGGPCVPSIGLASFTFNVRYNGSVVDVVDAFPGPDLGKTGRTFTCFESKDEELDVFTYACASPGQREGLQGSAVLARLEVAPVGAGNTLIGLDGELSGPYSEDIPADIKGAAVIVESRPGGGNPNPDPNQQGDDGDPEDENTPTPVFGTINALGTPVDSNGVPIGDPSIAATVVAEATAVAEAEAQAEETRQASGRGPTPEGSDSEDDPENADSSSASGDDDGDGGSFGTTLLITLGVIAGVGVVGAAGYSAVRLRRG